MRTTLDIEKPILDELKRLQKVKKKPLGQITSSLLAEVLKTHQDTAASNPAPNLPWVTSRMGAKIDLADKEALHRALDGR